MKIRPYAFKADPVYEYMDRLSSILGAPLQNEMTLQIPAARGMGSIKNIFLEENFCIRYYHFKVNAPTAFCWFFDSESEEELYKLIFTCTPLLNSEGATGGLGNHYCNNENAAILYAGDSDNVENIPSNTWVTKIALLFTRKWLEDNFMDAACQITDIINILEKKNIPCRIPGPMEKDYYNVVTELVREMDKEIFPVIHIKTKSLILLTEFLSKLVPGNTAEFIEQRSFYYQNMVKVEERLHECLLTTMPSIAKLSAEFNMSPSTLQRHFKMVYEKNIYQYYLEQKLAIGKELIASKKNTVSEVAYLLGYNKINSFSRIFKKYFGILPKDVNSLKKIG